MLTERKIIMKAMRIHRPEGPQALRLEEIDQPQPGAGQVLIKVAVAGVNFADQLATIPLPPGMEGGPHQVTFPNTPGFEVAGTIAALGQGVTGLTEGERVVAVLETGGYAEYALAPARSVVKLPAAIDFAQATAALLVQGTTAYGLLHDATKIQPGESVLVEAAAGGVGSLAVQLAKLAGAGLIIGLVGSNEKRALVERLGPDLVINYTEPGWVEQVYRATGGRGVDIALDSVGGQIGGQVFNCLAPLGRMVTFGGASNQPLPFMQMMGALSVKGLNLMGFGGPWLRPGRSQVAQQALSGYLQEGKLEVIIGQTFSLEQAGQALMALRSRQTVGKTLLRVA
jgi:NADPH2:quinone reductase